MKDKKIVIYNEKRNPAFVKTVVVKYAFPKVNEFITLFNSVDWERTPERIITNKKHSVFAVCLYIDNSIVAMGRVVGDGAYFTIYDVVVHKNFQGLGLGSVIINEIVQWYKTIQDDDTFLYVNASKNKEHFYEKFGFVARPNNEVGAGMKWYGENE